jgi:hypothetical protein
MSNNGEIIELTQSIITSNLKGLLIDDDEPGTGINFPKNIFYSFFSIIYFIN